MGTLMKLAFIGDIVGKPGRDIIAQHLPKLRKDYGLDLVIANYENASHGFGLTKKNCEELLSYGIDVMTGGNHSWDKKEVFLLYKDYPLIRPINYPRKSPGEGLLKIEVLNHQVAIINVMGHYTMPMVDNPFIMMDEVVTKLKEEGIKHIIVDIHAEATSEKLAMMHILKERVSALFGTHTHVGTDDLMIIDGCCYVSDVGLTGCRDGVIGMQKDIPMNRFLTGIGGHFDIAKKCQNILQIVVFELDDEGRGVKAEKIKIYDNGEVRKFDAREESY
ncbi:MAG: Phosphoesterase family protein [uncultured Sulfurovum sp.]|uniref:Phosphoesterase family protein n=1 Tax=uncultured Sulfurovum sp. TaxID=269237 RepID=A0A6S6S6S8_9BACT|nr:MAG: Phosphoesterase family protein [uncultured Sulfurovum sp.]